MSRIRIEPCGPLEFRARVPGSKSHTNRALICAALANGTSTLVGASDSDDTRLLAEALRKSGVPVDARGPDLVVRGGRRPAAGEYRLGNAGTALRFFTAFAALGRGRFTIDGDARMRERPIGGLVRALRDLGCEIRCALREGVPPVALEARGIPGGTCAVRDDTSSQFVSALLLAAPYADAPVTLEVTEDLPSWPYVFLTVETMAAFGVAVAQEAANFRVPTGTYAPRTLEIEPDPAAANYLFAAAAVTGGRAAVPGIRRGEGESRFLEILESMGGHGVDVDMNDCPDSVQTLAVVALFAEGPTRIRNVRNLRVKETDRLSALAKELRKLGADVREFEDGLEILPGKPRPALIETYNDHRMAMSFAIAGLATPGIEIANPACVSKSFPRFWETLEACGVHLIRLD